MARAIARLRGWLNRMSGSWRPGPAHRAAAQRVEQLEQRAEKLGAKRRDVLQLRLEVIARGRDDQAR